MKTKPIYIFAVIICAILLISAPAFATIVLEVHSETEDGITTFTDSSSDTEEHIITGKGGAKHSNVDARGATSMFFDGSGDYLSIPYSADWNFESGDFTIDTWVKVGNLNSTVIFLSDWESQGGSNRAWEFGRLNTNIFYFDAKNSAGIEIIRVDGDTTVESDTWYHVAVVRSGSTVKLYLNGSEDSIDISGGGTISNSTVPLTIGAQWQNGAIAVATECFGYLDDLYIRKGEALEQYQLASIILIGGVDFEADRTQRRLNMTSALNNGGVNELALGYSQSEINELADLYEDANGGLSPADVVIGDLTWSYLSGTLPGGGSHVIGDAYTYDGKWYMKLGSGLEGVPEVPKGPALIIAMLCLVCAVVRKKLVPDDGDRFNIENKGTGVDQY